MPSSMSPQKGFHPQPSCSWSETCGPPAESEHPGLWHLAAQHQPGCHLSNSRKAWTEHHRGHIISGFPNQSAGLRCPWQCWCILQRGECRTGEGITLDWLQIGTWTVLYVWAFTLCFHCRWLMGPMPSCWGNLGTLLLLLPSSEGTVPCKALTTREMTTFGL